MQIASLLGSAGLTIVLANVWQTLSFSHPAALKSIKLQLFAALLLSFIGFCGLLAFEVLVYSPKFRLLSPAPSTPTRSQRSARRSSTHSTASRFAKDTIGKSRAVSTNGGSFGPQSTGDRRQPNGLPASGAHRPTIVKQLFVDESNGPASGVGSTLEAVASPGNGFVTTADSTPARTAPEPAVPDATPSLDAQVQQVCNQVDAAAAEGVYQPELLQTLTDAINKFGVIPATGSPLNLAPVM